MENRLAAERVIIANLLFMLLTFRFFHTATIIVRLDRSTCRRGDSAASNFHPQGPCVDALPQRAWALLGYWIPR